MRPLKELRPRTARFALLPALAVVLVGSASLYGAAFERPREAPSGLLDPEGQHWLERLALLPEPMLLPPQRLRPVEPRPLALGRVKEAAAAAVVVKERPWTAPMAAELRRLLAERMDIAVAPMPELPPRELDVETLPAAAPGRDSPVFGAAEKEQEDEPAAPIKVSTELLTVNATGMLRDPDGKDYVLLESRFDEGRMIPEGGRYGPFLVEALGPERIRLVDEMGQVIEGPPRSILGRSHQGHRRLTEGRSRLSDQLRPERKAPPARPKPARRRNRRRGSSYGRSKRSRRGGDDDD